DSRYATSSYGGPVARAKAQMDSFYGQISLSPVAGATISAGARRDDHDRFGGATSFAANAVYSPNGGSTTLRASYGEGFKAPSLFQLFSDYGNTSLRPETSRSWDAGVTQRALDGAIELGVTLFHRNISNQIAFISCATSTGICTNRPYGTYDNVARAQAKGVEMGLRLRPVAALRVDANYSYVQAENRITGRDLARRPRHSLNLGVDYEWANGLKTGATITQIGNSFDNASNTRRLEGYTLVDVRAAYRVTPMIEVFGRIENLFDEAYETGNLYGTPGRGAYTGVRLAF
ncbi:MAG: TonB-dependent receptor, partial [Sphingopyxis sp.]